MQVLLEKDNYKSQITQSDTESNIFKPWYSVGFHYLRIIEKEKQSKTAL